MEGYRRSYQLYSNLVKYGNQKLREIVNSPHATQFIVNSSTGRYFKTLYIDQLENSDSSQLVPPPNDETCVGCKSHFLFKRPKIDHGNDLRIGSKLEHHFQSYLNSLFNDWELSLVCDRADTELLNMPDFKITNTETREDIFYFEFKCIFKPFIKVGNKINGAQCYSHSMTLDCDEKLDRQRKLIRDNRISSKTAYVYWYDIPCVKGVFWQFSDNIFKIQETAQQYRRIEQGGDFRNGRQVGHVDKIYIPLHSMRDFNSLINHIIAETQAS